MATKRRFPDEPPTMPGLAIVPCPACRGEDGKPQGYTMLVIESATGHKSRAAVCELCLGRKRIRRDVYDGYVAGRAKGTEPPKRGGK